MNSSTSAASPDPAAPEIHDPSAFWDVRAHLRLWVVAAAGVAIDLTTKSLAFSKLDPDGGKVIIPHLTRLQRSLNTGALFGLGKGLTPVFILASIVALGFVLFLFASSSRKRWTLHVGLGLVLAGALGNLYDRAFSIADVVTYTRGDRSYTVIGKVLEDGHDVVVGAWPDGAYAQHIPLSWKPAIKQRGVVRDFIRMEPQIRIGGYHIDVWPWVFNIADSLLVAGVALLMWNFWRDRRAEKVSPAVSPAAGA